MANSGAEEEGAKEKEKEKEKERGREKEKALIGKFRTNQPCGRSGTSGSRLASLACSPPPVHSDQGRRKI